MPKKPTSSSQSLLDAIRPSESEGPLRSVVLATYGLSLEQPNFFEHDFLPTLLGLGGVRDRGYLAPVALERKLSEIYCGLICDAHALAEGGRPSLQIDVVPISRPRQHAKVVCIHRQRLVRLIVTSANLTHAGYRSQREVAAVLDFHPEGSLPPQILTQAVTRWLEALGDSATVPIRRALEAALTAVAGWSPSRPAKSWPQFEIVFGGGGVPLWRQLVERWPANEPLLSWQVCSPFWPAAEATLTPFEAIAKGLQERGASLDKTSMELICLADVPGERGRPVFPFALISGLHQREFPIRQGRIVAARLDALEDEVPERMAEGQRALHAKWIMLRGPRTAVALLGSANFTNTGLGVGHNGQANLEAGILLSGPIEAMSRDGCHPPLAERGAVDWSSLSQAKLAEPATDLDDHVHWPHHIRQIELDIDWGHSPSPKGTLIATFDPDEFCPTSIGVADDTSSDTAVNLIEIEQYPSDSAGQVRVDVGADIVPQLLTQRTVHVIWDVPPRNARFPINILDTAKAGLPSVLGAEPDEQQLLAYFRGRISEDDLLASLEEQAQALLQGKPCSLSEPPSIDFQNYLIREFVESLFGLQEVLRSVLASPRALEIALLGYFSPSTLGDRVAKAYMAGRRSPTATAFQLTELLRVISALSLDEVPLATEMERTILFAIQQRAVERILGCVATIGQRVSFQDACRDPHFASFVRSSLPKPLATRFLAIPTQSDTSEPIPVSEVSDESGQHEASA